MHLDMDIPTLRIPEDALASAVVSPVPDSSPTTSYVEAQPTPNLPEDALASPVVSPALGSSPVTSPGKVQPTPKLSEDTVTYPVASSIPDSSPTASPAKVQPTKRASFNNSVASLANRNMSTVSLVLAEQPTAHSGHFYLPEGVPLKKIKSRPDYATTFSNKSSTSSLGGKGKGKAKDKGNAKDKDKAKDRDESKEDGNRFSNMSKKAAASVRRLFRIGDKEEWGAMKWEDFLKVMRDMGFTCDPSAAGSSVRFYPPDKKDKPITFHKPHPDSTLPPHKVQEYGKKLKDHYGWGEEELRRAAAES